MTELRPYLGPLLHAAGFRHGFFGRRGGDSAGNYASLNCSFSVGDDPDRVHRNHVRIAAYLGVQLERLVTVCQVHGSAVVDADEFPHLDSHCNREADALIATRADYALGIRTADCVPVLVGCRDTGAVAAIHAGWRGIVAGVVPAAIERMVSKGARPNAMVVAVGPHIGVRAFEVSEEVAAQLAAVDHEGKSIERSGCSRPRVRLSSIVLSQLISKGVRPNQIDLVEACTFENTSELFSFRRDGVHSGRQLSAICPEPRAH